MKSLWVAIVVAFVVASACARQDWIDRTLVTEDVTGVWSGSTEGSVGRPPIQLELRQQGAKVTGMMKVSPVGSASFGSSLPIEGNLAGDVFTFRDQRGVYSGELTVGGDDMAGQIFGPGGKRKASLRRESPGNPSDSATR